VTACSRGSPPAWFRDGPQRRQYHPNSISRQLLPPCQHAVQPHYEELIKTERIRQRRKAWEGYMATANDPLEAEQESDASRE